MRAFPINSIFLPVSLLALVLGGSVSGGCATKHVAFRPAVTSATGTVGRLGAYLDLRADEKSFGYARIWTKGAFERSGAQPPVLHVGMRIHNDSETAISLDTEKTEIEIRIQDGEAVVQREISEIQGTTEVPAESDRQVELLFPVPNGVKLTDVVSFELKWVVKTDSRQVSMAALFYKASRHRHWAYYGPPYWSFWYPYGFFWLPPWGYYSGYFYRYPVVYHRYYYPFRYYPKQVYRHHYRSRRQVPRRPAGSSPSSVRSSRGARSRAEP